jgi:LacI family transcriptional regulator
MCEETTMPTTITDIARAAGVSQTTVFRALRDKEYVGSETKARIKRIAKKMKYSPNDIAASLSSGRSHLVGVVATPDLFPPFRATIGPLEVSLRKAGYSMLFCASTGSEQGEHACLEHLKRQRVAGVIVLPCAEPAKANAYDQLIEYGTKIVVVNRCVDGLAVPQIFADSFQTSRLATDHLISLGHRNISYLAIPETEWVGRERARGFRDALAEAGIPLRASSIVTTPFGEQHGAAVMRQLLKRKHPPTAIVARHIVVAMGAMQAIFDEGLSVPGDISIVANGNVWYNNLLRTPITTVLSHDSRMVEIAVMKLLKMLAGKRVDAETTVLDVELVIRGSTAPPRKS